MGRRKGATKQVNCTYCDQPIFLLRSNRTGKYYPTNSRNPTDFHNCSEKKIERARYRLEKLGRPRTDLLEKENTGLIKGFEPMEEKELTCRSCHRKFSTSESSQFCSSRCGIEYRKSLY